MKRLLLLTIMVLFSVNSYAQEIRIACAANFILPMKEISAQFEKQNNIKVTPTFGSTGMLYSQIKNGAPFDIFFAADVKRPQMLAGSKTSENLFLYAKGQAVLWTKSEKLKDFNNYKDVLDNASKIAIALPKAAPYGEVVIDMMKEKNILNLYQQKLVYGKNVAQSFQYAYSDLADACFCALSQALSQKGKNGKYFTLDTKKVIQGGFIINKNKETESFLKFAVSSEDILSKYGYLTIQPEN